MSMRRIAELAGVSSSTVSLALRGSPKIPEETRQRVIAIAERFGYRPNAKVTELMSQVRRSAERCEACFGVVSFYPNERPWESSPHLMRVYESMRQRAHDLHYRIEPLWVRADGMTNRRLCGILDARGIEGLLCLGSPDVDEVFPPEFDHYAIVTQGVSIKTPLHRVVPHAAADMTRVLEAVHRLGYRRPGLFIAPHGLSADLHISAYLGWCFQKFSVPLPVPMLRLVQADEGALHSWMKSHRPDVIIAVHEREVLLEFGAWLRRRGIRRPGDIGVAAISQVLEGTEFTGLQANQRLLGAWSVELLVDRILHHDLGIPQHPRMLMVESQWVNGNSLRLSLG